MITYSLVKKASSKDLAAINRIAPQLSPAGGSMTMAYFRTMLTRPDHFLMVARKKGEIVGMAMLVFMYTPHKVRGRIESVVVDEEYRHHGIGTHLLKRLIKLAKSKKIHSVALGSEPKRKEANLLYKHLGFDRQESNAYRIKF